MSQGHPQQLFIRAIERAKAGVAPADENALDVRESLSIIAARSAYEPDFDSLPRDHLDQKIHKP